VNPTVTPIVLEPTVEVEVNIAAAQKFGVKPGDVRRQATALVHETYLRLADQTQLNWKDRVHFYGIAARVMRRILVEHARAHRSTKRGGLAQKISLEEARELPAETDVDLLKLDSALESFAKDYPRKSEVVELKFFGGLDAREIAEVLQVSEKTVLRDWNFAKLWLCRALTQDAA